jgi:hypothetical protein
MIADEGLLALVDPVDLAFVISAEVTEEEKFIGETLVRFVERYVAGRHCGIPQSWTGRGIKEWAYESSESEDIALGRL